MGDPGAGLVERNTAPSTTIPKQVKSFLPQKTIMMPHAVEMNKDLYKKSIVLEDILDIVQIGGS